MTVRCSGTESAKEGTMRYLFTELSNALWRTSSDTTASAVSSASSTSTSAPTSRSHNAFDIAGSSTPCH